jgi:2,4-dienoyl-CoA reductase-like NADH-dependent reductase (Old Yellow Enzyme family)
LDIDRAKSLLGDNTVPLVGFGRYFIANPDLVERLKADVPLNTVREREIYGRDEAGYTDYPRHSAVQ